MVRPAAGGVREVAKAAQRNLVLGAAAALLSERGVGALSLREVARRAGASTQVIYTLFGSKDGLLAALYQRALDQLGEALREANAPDPLDRIRAIAVAYRSFALREPDLYRVISGRIVASTAAAVDIRRSPAFVVLRDAVEAALDAGALAPADPDAVTDTLWAAVHGIVSLELSGYFPDEHTAAQRFFIAGEATLRGLGPQG